MNTAEPIENNPNVIVHLEDNYPEFDRREQGWKLTGFQTPTQYNKPKPTMFNPRGLIPEWIYLGWDLKKKYDGEKLRALRLQNGVGKIKKG
jgi:hypothetical protein